MAVAASTECPRPSHGVAATRLHGISPQAIANWTEHEYSPRDRVIIAGAWDAHAAGAPRSAYDSLACDILRAPAVECDA